MLGCSKYFLVLKSQQFDKDQHRETKTSYDNNYRRRKEEEGQRRMEKDKKKKKSWFLWKKMGMMTTQENDDNFIERRWSNVDKTDDNSSFKRRQSDNSSLKRRRDYKTNDISSLKRRKIDNSSSKRRSSKEDKNEEDGLTFRLKKIASRVSKMFLSTFFPFASIWTKLKPVYYDNPCDTPIFFFFDNWSLFRGKFML